ncbi:MAG: STAS domain-containing protein [Solirubrobacteraceae bacterium]
MSSQPDDARQHSRATIARLRASLPRPSLPWQDPTPGPGQTRVIGLGTLDIRTTRVANTCALKLFGQLNHKTNEWLSDVLERTLEHDTQVTVLDVSYLVLIDHAGVHTILTAYLQTTNQREKFLIIPTPQAAQRVIDAIHGPVRYTTRALSLDRPRRDHRRARNAERRDRVRINPSTRSPRRGQVRCRDEQ